jgi:hypothetical protein
MTSTVDEAALEQVLARIVTDYEAIEPPFEAGMLPERAAITTIDETEDRALFSTLTVALDYQRSSEQLWTKTRELWHSEPWIYDPDEVVARRQELSALFEEWGMRYGQQDADIWYQNATVLHRTYDDSPLVLFERHEYDAPRILDAVRSGAEFTYLGGDKIGPLWLRFIHEDVQPLANITDVWMPIDTHIQTVSRPLLGGDYPVGDLRTFWTAFCHDRGFDPVGVDQPLWLIGTHWDEWGREYLQHCMAAAEYTTPQRSDGSASTSALPARSECEELSDWVDAVAATLDIDAEVVWELGAQFRTEDS